MVVHGHIENGTIIPHDGLAWPDGTLVVITSSEVSMTSDDQMSPEEQARYASAFARIDVFANENPGDTFSGADHDQVLYGAGL